MRALLVAATLTIALLAGCAGDVPLLTAKEARPTADEAAALWADDASLQAVVTVELGDDIKSMMRQQLQAARDSGELEQSGMSAEDEAMLDAMLSTKDAPGDGKAAFWAYGYFSETRQAAFVVVVSSDGVLFAEQVEMEWDTDMAGDVSGMQDIAGWEVDSDAAAAAAMSDEAYRSLAGDPKSIGFAALAMDDGTPYWVLFLIKVGWSEEDWEDAPQAEGGSAGPPDGSQHASSAGASEWEATQPMQAMVIVDARNGSVVPSDSFGALSPIGPIVADAEETARELAMEFGSRSGELTALGPEASESFPVLQEGHKALALAVEVSNPILADVEVTVTDPEGRVSTFGVPMSLGLASRETVVLDIVPTGDWQVSVALDPALRNTYTVEWCTDGIAVPDSPFGTTVEACSEVPGSGQAFRSTLGSRALGFVLASA